MGGGASGLAAALAAAQTAAPNTHITLLERNPRPGKKLLATGNGRCNLDNTGIAPEMYFTADPAALRGLLRTVDAADPRGWLEEMGLYTRVDEAGRVYPYSNQAADVLSLLMRELAEQGVELCCGCRFTRLVPTKHGFQLWFEEEGEEKRLAADAVILALGGKAGPQFGTDGFGPAFARQCGCRTEPLYPCLVPLRCEKGQVKGLAGLRIRAEASLMDGAAPLAVERGEVQFTEYGLSGIAVMQLSGLLAPGRAPKAPAIELKLFPDLDEAALTALLTARAVRSPRRCARELLLGLLAPRAAQAVWEAAACGSWETPADRLPPAAWSKLAHAMQHWRFTDLSPCEWKNAQTTGGGLALSELEPDTFALKGCPKLYFVGETLDCAGSCGGFNLHWAFGSGIAAGRAAARLIKQYSSPAQTKQTKTPKNKRKQA